MCFGNTQTSTVNTTQDTQYQPNQNVANAANQSLSSAQALQNAGYTAYNGQRVADFTDLQNQGFGVAGNMVNSTNSYLPGEYSGIANYGGTQLNQVQPNTIASQMSPYMNAYVSEALAPQEQALQQQFAGQDQQLNAAATESGAFGDDRAGIQQANLTQQQDIAQTGLLGQAYTNAFNTAIGAGAQDVGNQMQAGEFNVGSQETMAQNQLGAANAEQNLYNTELANEASQYGLSAQAGGTQQQQAQAELNVPYSNYLAAQQYPFLTEQNLNSAVATGAGAMPASSTMQGTQVTQQPNNSGWGILGTLGAASMYGGSGGFSASALGSGLSSLALLSDERAKEDIKKIGEIGDGDGVLNLYRFRYKGDPARKTHVGFMAQEVERKNPAAVVTFRSGLKGVDYARATEGAVDAWGIAA